jgi:hypothetical protein
MTQLHTQLADLFPAAVPLLSVGAVVAGISAKLIKKIDWDINFSIRLSSKNEDDRILTSKTWKR